MESSTHPQNPNTMASMYSSSLEALQLPFENLHLFDNSSLSLNASSTGVFPDPQRNHGLGFSRVGSFRSCLDYFTGESMNLGSSMFDNVNWFNSFSNVSPGFQPIFSLDSEYSYGYSNWVIDMAKTEEGSKDLQKLLSNSKNNNMIFSWVFDFIVELMIDQSGRYLFQKLIESADETQLQMILEKLLVPHNYIYYASLLKYGSCSIKKLITVLEKSPLITCVIKALSDKFEKLMMDPIGHYVIFECLDVLDSQTNDPLNIQAMKHCLELVRHEQGSVSMSGFVTRIKGPRRDQLLKLISRNSAFLAQDPTGNYVVQCVIRLQNPAMNDQIFRNLEGYYVKLSTTKTGSYVVEHCLLSSGLDRVINELLRSDRLVSVAKDRYGNYVVQTALKESKKREISLHGSLVVKLEQHLKCLQHGYGRNVVSVLRSLQ
ncbi:hypothetical protein Gohar_015369 [Gossypium harknessii]|uniref:PUM-HD domain-containing protein n=1 Tax=Gossypium harknessii TaxID=34285 RepID=A0A7J9G030_9ROSI|nr:hypothetical protein [Gossypium harknessii]